MSHRRKSSHPVCKTRRNLGTSWDVFTDGPTNEDKDDEQTGCDVSDSIMVTEDEAGQQISIPSDLYKDFEAVRTQSKLDATDLMRRLLKDYQSLASGSEKSETLTDEPGDNDMQTGSDCMVTKVSIASDVSLATTRVDTDEDEYQGLDLSVNSARKISSRLFDTKSLNSIEPGRFEQPLDLTCTKSIGSSADANRESPSSSHMELSGVNNEFNYVYVYPGLYPPGSGMLSQDMDAESPKGMTSPVPELLPPEQLSPTVHHHSRSQFLPSSDLASADQLVNNFGMVNPNIAYNTFMNNISKSQLPRLNISPVSKSPPLSDIKPEPIETDGRVLPAYYKMHTEPEKHIRSGGSATKHNKQPKEAKRSNEMKIISENTSYPGVYTSVMKLPWSRRTRTKKPKHKLKLEDTLIPQFMLDQQQPSPESPTLPPPNVDPFLHAHIPSPSAIPITDPRSSQSVMMVYPNATTSAYGKPIRKRGRPPKLPMLAKLLQHEQESKRAAKKAKEKAAAAAAVAAQAAAQAAGANPIPTMPADLAQNSGGMLVYSGGQMMGAFNAMPTMQQMPTMPVSADMTQPIQNQVIPNMAQAQLIGQIPLSQITGGQIQFLGQFPANALPVPGQHIQAIPVPVPENQLQQMIPQATLPKPNNVESSPSQDDGIKQETPGPAAMNYQYAFQPMLFPTPVSSQIQMQPMTAQIPQVMSTVEDTEESDKPTMEANGSSASSNGHDTGQVNQMTGQLIESVNGPATQMIKHEDSNIVSTMSTTSIANTGSGAIYQEMILSSKALVDVKKRKRQTAIQLLKSKSNDQNFLCTSFRIRPRLVAQAEAQRERMAAKGTCSIGEGSEMEIDQKNLNGPQNDGDHFGDKNGSCDVDLSNIQIKSEVESDEVYGQMEDHGLDPSTLCMDPEMDGVSDMNVDSKVLLHKRNSMKKFMLKGSQRRKARFYGSSIVNESQERQDSVSSFPEDSDVDQIANEDTGSLDISGDSNSNDMFQELYNCKFCNQIIPVSQMEIHSLEHLKKKSKYHCNYCGLNVDIEAENLKEKPPTCEACNEKLVKVNSEIFTRYGHGKIACDECQETFKSLPDFYEHKTEIHKNENSLQGEFECDFCGKVYQYYHALQFHRRAHRERKVPCLDKTCSMKFRSRKEMENHFDVKHPDKKEYYHCIYEGCTKRFLKNFHLQEHIRVKHYNIKAFQCPWPGCVKEFAAQRHLKIHLLIHRDEKPMKCDHCDYRCRQRSAMNWHMRKHPDVPYKYKRATKSPSMSAVDSE